MSHMRYSIYRVEVLTTIGAALSATAEVEELEISTI